MEHHDNDDCMKYHPEHELRVVGYRETVVAEDIGSGDFVQDPTWSDRRRWYEVVDVGAEGDDVHLALWEASASEVAQARREACGGHETTRGAIGDTEYCNGACVDGHRGPLT